MDDFINYFVRPGVLVIALAVYVIVWTIRTVLETKFPALKKVASPLAPAPMYATKAGMWWNELGLHVLPCLVGGLFGFIHSAFLQGPLTRWDAVMFDCGIGWFSGTLYKGVMQALTKKLGITSSVFPEGS